MKKEINLCLTPKDASSDSLIKLNAAKQIGIKASEVTDTHVIRRSIDARTRNIYINLSVVVTWDEPATEHAPVHLEYPDVSNKDEVVIVGAGPAGLFAALRLIELGLKPIVIDRGDEISERKKKIATLCKDHVIDEDSNYCFGEGGAGTFSDGKLYTRSQKRGNPRKILEVFSFHGANPEILVESHPHIGTDKLPQIIKKIRQTILDSGGIIKFRTKVVNLILQGDEIKGVETAAGEQVMGKAVILATGHSARDIYEMLHRQGIQLEAKPFAMGIRVEHPQELIDSIQYHAQGPRNEYLPAASYSLVAQANGRGVYSFCMCPGGFIVPAATQSGEIVVNGMSSSGRNYKLANSGIVVETRLEDFPDYEKHGVMAGLRYQQALEKEAFESVNQGFTAPAQRLEDFLSNRVSSDLPKTSYIPGVASSPMHNWLPKHISSRLQLGFIEFGKKMRGYLTNEAIILGVESRTSTPVRIPRDSETFQHIVVKGLYPCGEGAGYAGGIVSSAIDGERCAEKIAGFKE